VNTCGIIIDCVIFTGSNSESAPAIRTGIQQGKPEYLTGRSYRKTVIDINRLIAVYKCPKPLQLSLAVVFYKVEDTIAPCNIQCGIRIPINAAGAGRIRSGTPQDVNAA